MIKNRLKRRKIENLRKIDDCSKFIKKKKKKWKSKSAALNLEGKRSKVISKNET